MTLVKNMAYEPAKLTKPKGDSVRRALLSEADRLGTPTILWFLVKRHKVGLLITSNIVMVILYVFPFTPSLVLSLFQ